MRIAVAGLHTECSTFNPVLTIESDFRVLRGAALLADPYFNWLAEYPAVFLPTLHARAIAGGPVAAQTYAAFKAEILAGIGAMLPLEGVYLAMHGAIYVQGMEDAEGDLITSVRALVGEECRISASYDLHGNLSQRIIDALDLFSTYRTAPHIDVEATMRRAVALLIRSLDTGMKPHLVWVPVPVLVSGERSSTQDPAAAALYGLLPGIEAEASVWDASLQVGYVWADEPRATAAAVVTGDDLAVAVAAAEGLAAAYWAAREAFVFGMPVGSVDDCVARAMASATHPVILAESGDNPTGGSVGDRAEVLAALLDAGAEGVILAGIADRRAVDRCSAAGIGAMLRLSIGGTLDGSSKPVQAEVRVVHLLECDDPAGREAVVQIAGVTLVLTGKRRPFHNLADFARLGLDPAQARILVVKSGYLSPELAPLANPALMALSPGVVDQSVERLPRHRMSRPTFPFDRRFAWVAKARVSKRATT